MKHAWLGTTALVAAGFVAAPALAEDGIHLTVGGYFKEAFMAVADDNDIRDSDESLTGTLQDPGFDRNTDGFFNDAEVDFTGTTTLDNGLEVGAHIEVEGETQGHMIDEAYVWFAGGFGEVRIGSDDEALHKACVIPPGGSSNFSAFSPNQWGANTGGVMSFIGGIEDNSICRGVDDNTDAQKIIYTSPVFAGFQLTASYTPNGGDEGHDDGVGPHVGMPGNSLGESRHNTSVAINYGYDGSNWGLRSSLGASFEGHVEQGQTPGQSFRQDRQDFYQAGISVYFGNFAVGIGGEYFHDLLDANAADIEIIDADSWVAGIGASYSYDAWIFGLQYAHRENDSDVEIEGLGVDADAKLDRVVVTTTYLLGPGMNLDAELGYTWLNADDGFELFGVQADGYDAFEAGLGATLIF
jgi:predicted porin